MKDFLQFLQEQQEDEVRIRLKCPKCAYMGDRTEFDMQSRIDDGMNSKMQPVTFAANRVDSEPVNINVDGDVEYAGEVEKDGDQVV